MNWGAYQQKVEAHLVCGTLAIADCPCPTLGCIVAAGHQPVPWPDCCEQTGPCLLVEVPVVAPPKWRLLYPSSDVLSHQRKEKARRLSAGQIRWGSTTKFPCFMWGSSNVLSHQQKEKAWGLSAAETRLTSRQRGGGSTARFPCCMCGQRRNSAAS